VPADLELCSLGIRFVAAVDLHRSIEALEILAKIEKRSAWVMASLTKKRK
jgi:hypothetical protein